MTKNLISRKFISLLLVIVMALGLLPIQAMAENGSLVGGNTGGLIPGVGQGEISGSAISTAGQFTRITLVKIGFKHDNPAIADRTKLLGNYQVLGSIDVSDVSRAGGLSGAVRQQDAAKVSAWYQSNALDYAKAAYSGGTGGGSIITSVTSYAREGARKTGSWSQFIVYDVKLVVRGGTLPDLTSNEDLETYNPTATYEVGEDTEIISWTVKVPFDTTPDFYNHTNTLYAPTKEDCTFHGWLAYAPGWPVNEAGKSIHSEAIYSLPTYVDFKDVPGITLTALWEPWFRFDPDGTKFTDNTTDIKVIHQSDLGDKLPEAVKEGYYQDGWVNVEEPDKLVTLGDLKATDSPMTLIPKWSANITFDGNGGQVNGKGIDVIPLSKLDKMPGASKSGFRLTGWYTAAENGSAVSLETLKKNGVPATVYAHWAANSYSGGGGGGGGGSTSFVVDFDSNGGSEVPSQTVPSGKTPTKPTDPTKPFYEFTGWYTDKDCTKPFNFEKDKIRKNTVLYAGWKYIGPSTYLTTDHIAYICGFTDGTVRPNANISRGEVAMIFYRLLNEQTKTAYKTDKNSYTDVSAADWDNIAISTLTKLGILKGRGNGIFAADDNITRAEFAVICSRFDTLAEGKSTFKDVPASHWAYKEIFSAAAKGWVEGYEDGSFRPDNNITRAETITLVNRVLHRATEKFKNTATNSNAMKVWPDNKDLTQWYYVAMQEATHSHDFGFDAKNVESWTYIHPSKVRNE